ncbi:MAG TPA: MarR family winged helix-turn-helix transcriptional regulator [Vicinamibacterales bacterium]|jgi:DNA-binding MarR family transcriptional regulator
MSDPGGGRKSAAATAPAATAAVLARDLLHVTMQMMRSVAREMRRAPLPVAPAQVGALMRLKMAPVTMSELARHMGVSLPTVSKSVDVLVDRGWVERWVDPTDRRQTIVRLTAEGRRVTTSMKRQSERHVATLLAGLTPQQRAQLMSTLDVLKDVLPPLP